MDHSQHLHHPIPYAEVAETAPPHRSNPLPVEMTLNLPDRIRTILHRDLKVGAHVKLRDDMPLFGGPTDLDSLDALLLVACIEKEFRIKIPNESIGREAFQSIGTLAAFLERRLALPASGGGEHHAAAVKDPLDMLPHGESFRFLTRMRELTPGESAQAIWSVTGAEPYLAGHFPGEPIVPGVLIAEAMAQLSGIVGATASIAAGTPPTPATHKARIAHLDIRYRSLARPPVDLLIESKRVRSIGQIGHFDVRASVQEQVIAEGSLDMGFSS